MHSSTLLSVVAFATAASALPQFVPPTTMNNSCNTGTQLCCNDISSVQQTNGFLNNFNSAFDFIPIFDFGHAGIQCLSATGIGGGDSGGSCAEQPVCCQKVFSNYLVGVGCSPVSATA